MFISLKILQMKKIISIMLILLVGLTIFSGCSSNTSEPVDNQQVSDSSDVSAEDNSESLQNSGSSSIPQPPALPED